MTKVSHVVVDGSNIATEGRSTPSLAQLEGAVAELRNDLPEAMIIVVVDATFAHRIDDSERERFEQALLRREYISPPAGAIGRGDAFLLRIAERVDGTVLSNDSFQEFHGEHGWLFDTGRLLGATPVPGVGWIFVPRSPVRGPKSHVALRDARKAQTKVEKAIAAATKEAVTPASVEGNGAEPGESKSSPEPPAARRSPQAVNEPLKFIEFVASHPLGVTVSGVVQAFTSHGAVVKVGDVRCYVPLSGLGEPAPRSAREILRKNEPRDFVVTALDPQRRGVELALPEVAVVSGTPSDETVEAEVALAKPRSRRSTASKAPRSPEVPEPVPQRRRPAPVDDVPVRRAAAKTVASRTRAGAKPLTQRAEKAPASQPGKTSAAKTTSKRASAAAGFPSDAATRPATARAGRPTRMAAEPATREAASAAKKPAVSKTRATPNKSVPNKAVAQPRKAAATHPVASTGKTVTAVKKTAPRAKRATPAAQKAAPAAKKPAPVAKKTAAVAKKTEPVAKKREPVAKNATPASKKRAPAAKKAVSAEASSAAGRRGRRAGADKAATTGTTKKRRATA
jgi:hypothetical protein